MSRCDRCGARRFSDYAALRPAGLPEAVTPAPAARRFADRRAARNAALTYRGVRWGLRQADLRAATS
ncbi:DUF6255 family natural product biosynthesis protein [Streptomyces triculaminicus]|uniref:DUF6255 family natural product biosynthesis protein n=1 Tax=Streptomyces triculaminicus TaxID=2816232 RepID=UPI0033D36D14